MSVNIALGQYTGVIGHYWKLFPLSRGNNFQ